MATSITLKINDLDADLAVGDSGASFVDVDLTHDYIIWTAGSDDVKDGEDEPTQDELNQASTLISDSVETQVAHSLLFDYSALELKEIIGMGENKRYVFAFSFDGDTATEPQLEAWNDSNHNSTSKNVLGASTPADSMVKAVCTTGALPGADWAKSGGTHIELAGSGASNIVKLNDGNGAITLLSGEVSRELYANIAIVIPVGYATPAIETFVSTVRFSWS